MISNERRICVIIATVLWFTLVPSSNHVMSRVTCYSHLLITWIQLRCMRKL